MRIYCPQRVTFRLASTAVFCLSEICVIPAQANPGPIVVNIPAQMFVAVSAIDMRCISMTYDENGNRKLQTVAPVVTTTTTWGTAAYGCFAWKQ
jgi:hypothetical protein